MAVPVQTPYQEYTANGVTTSFAVTFQCLSKDTLIVTINGLEQSPTLWNFTGGNVVFVAAPANLAIVGIKRSTALTREVTYQTYDNSFRPDVLNNDIDRLWHVLQENQYIYNKKVDKSAQIQTLGNLQGGGAIESGLTLSLKPQAVTADYAFGSSVKIPVITLNQDGTIKTLVEVDLAGTEGGVFAIPWIDVINTPTTLNGYGITDAYTKTEINTALSFKEDGANKGVPGGYAGLDTDGKIVATQQRPASTTVAGAVEIATSTEVNTATDTTRVVTPSTLLSGVKNHLNVSGGAPMYACRAWVCFDGTSATITPLAGGNVQSITDNGTGDYTVNFTTAMPDANYVVMGTADREATSTGMFITIESMTVSSVRILSRVGNGGNTDSSFVSVGVLR